MRVRFIHLLLVAALAVGQLSLFIHQTDLAAHPVGDVCSVCLHASALDHMAVAGGMALAIGGGASFLFVPVELPCPTSSAVASRARGPPSSFST
jgi:hypothetical protein